MSLPSAVAVGKFLPGMKTKISQNYQSQPLERRGERGEKDITNKRRKMNPAL